MEAPGQIVSTVMGPGAYHPNSIVLPILSGTNFKDFQYYTQISRQALEFGNLLSVVDGTFERTENDDIDFDRRNKLALYLLMKSISKEISMEYSLHNITSPFILWQTLHELFGIKRNDVPTTHRLRKELNSIKLAEEGDPKEFTRRIMECVNKLDAAGSATSEQDIMHFLLEGLPDSWESFKESITFVDDANQNLKYYIKRIHLKEKKIPTPSDEQSLQTTAFTTKLVDDITKQILGTLNKSKRLRDFSKVKCYNCQQFGHFKNKCPNPKVERPAMANFAINESESDSDGSIAFHTMAFSSGELIIDGFIVDSGASEHMVRELRLMKNIRFIFGKSILLGNGTRAQVTAIGTVSIRTKEGFIVTLMDVLLVPDLCANLISVSSIASRGYSASFDKDSVKFISKTGTIVASGIRQGKLFKLLATSNMDVDNSEQVALNAQASSDRDIMHARFGHVSDKYLSTLNKNDMVLGLNFIRQSNNHYLDMCRACVHGKMTKRDHPKYPHPIASKHALDRIHADIVGPITPVALGGYRWFMTVIDEATRMTWIILLRTKEEAPELLKNHLTKLMNLKKVKIANFKSDNGGEFDNHTFIQFLNQNGISIERSAPYNPEQNGLVERANRTVVECCRTLIHHAGLPFHFWAAAIVTACFLKNRLPHRGLMEKDLMKTPYEMWTDQKPDVSILRVFGCNAYTYVEKQFRSKLEKKSKPVIFCGYGHDAGMIAYRFYNMKTRKFFYSHNAIFEENKFYNSKSSLNNNAEMNDRLIIENFPEFISTLTYENEKQSEAKNQKSNEKVNEERIAIENGHVNEKDVLDPMVVIYDEEEIEDVSNDNNKGDHCDSNKGAPTHSLSLHSTRHSNNNKDNHCEDDNDLPLTLRRSDRISKPVQRLTFNDKHELHFCSHFPELPFHDEHELHFSKSTQFVNKDVVSKFSHLETIPEPTKFHEAAKFPQWSSAINEELQSMIDNSVFEWADLPNDRKLTGSHYIFKYKRDADGFISRLKVRLVAEGYSQIEGIDYLETFASVAKMTSIRMVLAIAAANDFEVKQMDVKTAFLNADLDEEIFMRPPEGYYPPDGDKSKVWKLKKAIYGLKQASRMWYKKLDSFLISLGFSRCNFDHSVYIRWSKCEQERDVITIVVVYVDDITIAGTMQHVDELRDHLSRRFKMTDLGDISFIIGIKVIRNRNNRSISLSQQQYLLDVLSKFKMSECKPVSTPLDPGCHLTREMCPKLQADIRDMSDVPYRNAVGSLMYLMVCTRPDIANAVGIVSQYMQNPGRAHWSAVQHIFRYLRGTSGASLELGGDPHNKIILSGFSDSDYAGDLDGRKSTSGYCFSLGRGMISYQSKRQPCVALSTTEAEYMACCSAAREAIWLRGGLSELGFEQKLPTLIHEDNQGCIALVRNPVNHERTKHIDVRFHFIRDSVEKGLVIIRYCATKDMIADILTKPLHRPQHLLCFQGLGIKMTSGDGE
jgi:hypothetical protein